MAPSSVAFNIFSGSYANFLEAVADEFNPPVVAYVLNTQFPTSSVQLIEIVLQDGTIIDVPETVYNFSSDGCAIHFEVDYIDGIVAQYSQNASVLVTYFPDSVGEGSCS